MHHELFHLYHSRAFEGCDAVWCGLWREGLAVHVAAELNPGASDAELVLTMPVPLRAAFALVKAAPRERQPVIALHERKRDIADSFGISVSAVDKHLIKATAHLTRCLEEKE